jgi:hypothetical protein
VTNYERIAHFDPEDFAGVVCDESSILKNMAGRRRQEITRFMRTRPYRLLCTATAAPNDYYELGTSSEALGYMGSADMLTRFFKDDVKKDYLGWGRKTYRFRGHSEIPFWRWVCTWARACRKPSDLGFDDGGFELPPLVEREHVLESSTARPGMLFAVPAKDLSEQREERRITLEERCEFAAGIVNNHTGTSIAWCHLNDEGRCLADTIPGAVEVSGSMSDEAKEERLLAFQSGEIDTLVTKPRIGCFGLNFQHCHNVVTFPSHSYEQYYQAVRRCYRFGQEHPVKVAVVSTEGEQRVLKNLQRKSEQASAMFTALVGHMYHAMEIESVWNFDAQATLPEWI